MTDIEFHAAAIGDMTTILPLFSVKGHTEDNKIVNRRADALTLPILAFRLDEFLGEPSADLFIKIDVQGAEMEVYRGLGRLRSWPRLAMVMEFTPLALLSRIRPETFLAEIAESFVIVELDRQYNAVREVTDALELSNRIRALEMPYCDLALVSNQHPRKDALLTALIG